MIWWLIVFLVTLIIIVIVYSAFTYTEAVLEVKSQPREPMLICDIHGVFREVHAIEFLDQKVCPHCFHSKNKVRLDESVISR